ncbi:uncharacterized protein (TIGR02118 family) [Homoserinimonas aerilata]|uniref:Uncharacterized protein (TIGR02118 family) n=1 Tax=Homoserinimonas aerilata TaxID=1162970 RepID=A0A542XX58_9MICO|nr:EthD family reductase [Homoserinimonas aerilata]TQL40422.1 uncharacterized protein (TIGR02118 family) [Homoserinimonas aerilata]
MTVLYGIPEDREAFRHYYMSTHVPIAQRMRGLLRWTLNWVDESDDDAHESIFLIVDLVARDRQSMDSILASPEGQAASADVKNFATGGVSYFRGYLDDVAVA